MKIYLSAGHGGTDPGAVGSGYRERDLTRQLVEELRKELSAKHTITVRDGSTNEFEDVLTKNFSGQDLVISVHINSYSNSTATGVEAWVSSTYPKNSATSAQKIANAMASATGLVSRGVKKEDWRIIYLAGKQGVNAVLLEVGFISNPNDMNAVVSNMNKIAKEISAALGGESAPVAPAPSPTPTQKEVVQSRWTETGTVKFSQDGPVYAEPNSVGANPVVSYAKGETLNRYDECVKTDKYLYLKYTRSSGGYGYLRFRSINADGSYGPAVGTIPQASAPTPEKITKRYPQTGSVQKLTRRVPVYAEPNSNGTTPIVWYEIGETLNRYDEVVETDKYVYVRYTRSSGGHGYFQLRTKSGNKYGPSAGKVV